MVTRFRGTALHRRVSVLESGDPRRVDLCVRTPSYRLLEAGAPEMAALSCSDSRRGYGIARHIDYWHGEKFWGREQSIPGTARMLPLDQKIIGWQDDRGKGSETE